MDVRGQHHVVELLGEHGRREERDRPQGLLAGIGEVVAHRGREDENAAGPDLVLGAVFQPQLAGASEDVLRLLGGVGVPAEPSAGLDLVDDGRGRRRPVSAIGGERARPSHRRVVHSSDLRTRKSCGINNER
jgi:hypothetical protein